MSIYSNQNLEAIDGKFAELTCASVSVFRAPLEPVSVQMLGNLPTSDPGVQGQVWLNGNTLMISSG